MISEEADRAERESQRKVTAAFAQRDEADLRELMASPVGRRFVFRVIDELAGVCDSSFSREPLVMAYREGRRAAGVELLEEVKRLAPADYVRGLGEAVATRNAE